MELERENEGIKERLHGLQEHTTDPGNAAIPTTNVQALLVLHAGNIVLLRCMD